MKEAIVTIINDQILPVRVKFPKCTNYYKTLGHALTDIRLSKCRPVMTV